MHRGSLLVGGLVPFTTIDSPGRLAAVVFTRGCPWRCRYCHNAHLWQGDAALDGDPSWVDVLDLIETRRGLLDAVVFSGGEPTAQAGLASACEAVRDRGFEVGLHTGGAFPQGLAAVLPLVDWVGFDVKAPFDEYERTTRVPGSGDQARESLNLLLSSGVPFEVRTTVHSTLLEPDFLRALAREIDALGVPGWVLQPFREEGAPAGLGASRYSADDVRDLTSAFRGVCEVRFA
jgi:pyruvate formate lyase activating enzyme